jgi:hypothetical protein
MGISPTYKVQFDGPTSSGLTKELSRELANTHGVLSVCPSFITSLLTRKSTNSNSNLRKS